MTTADDIKAWFEHAQEMGATHLLVVCDTFQYEDYPVIVGPGEDIREVVESKNGKNMQKVMEVYKVALGWEAQRVGMAWNL